MEKLGVLSLFAGIGGFELGLERTGGFETVAQCEIDPFCRRVLAKHWPHVKRYEDVRTLTADTLARDGITVDVICGGFPCQDISVAGNGAGIADGTRSGLWSEYARLVGELRPQFVLVENVAALLGRGLDRVLGDLAALGYDAEWHCIPASAVGAPHRRDRLWIVAYPHTAERRPDVASRGRVARSVGVSQRQEGAGRSCPSREDVADANSERQLQSEGCQCDERGRSGDCGQVLANASGVDAQGVVARFPDAAQWAGSDERSLGSRCDGGEWWAVEPDVGRVAHGVPQRVDRLKALGNAVVPQIPELLGRAILEARAA